MLRIHSVHNHRTELIPLVTASIPSTGQSSIRSGSLDTMVAICKYYVFLIASWYLALLRILCILEQLSRLLASASWASFRLLGLQAFA